MDDEPENDAIEDAKRRLITDFVACLNPKARTMWPDVQRAWQAEVRRASEPQTANTRASLYAAFQHVKGTITAAKLEELIDNAVKKGDAQILRVLAMLAGEDLTEKPSQAAGPGAHLIILRPHPAGLTPAEDAQIQTQIRALG